MQQEPYKPPTFDPLEAFVHWYLRQPFALPPGVLAGVHHVSDFSGLTLYRDDQFQAQLWLCQPGSEIKDHCHPSIDTYQIYVSGQVYLRLNGKPVVKPEDIHEMADGRANKNGFAIRVRPTDYHGATIGPKGGAFLNLQRWLNGPPQSAELDWEGEPLDEAHAKLLAK